MRSAPGVNAGPSSHYRLIPIRGVATGRVGDRVGSGLPMTGVLTAYPEDVGVSDAYLRDA